MGDENFVDELSEFVSGQDTDQSVSKELFKVSDIKAKTEVSDAEIKAIAKINFISEMLDMKEFPNMINNFLELRVSHKRKSRGEFIKSLSNKPSVGGFGMLGRRGGFER